MNRLLAIFFSFLILSSSGGVIVAKHFCGGELVETALFKELHSCCDGMDKQAGCCEMEHEVLQHDDNTPISFQSIDPPEPFLLYAIKFPTRAEVIRNSYFSINTYRLRFMTVPDLLVRNQSFLL